MEITTVRMDDLAQIMQIEAAGFNAAEAGSKASYQERIQKMTATFLVARVTPEKIAGFVCGPAVKERFVEDWMYTDTPMNLASGGHQLVFTLAVAPAFRGQRIGSQLLAELEKRATQLQRQSIALTCLDSRVSFYERNGYQNQGQADSTHGNEVWFNMEKSLVG